MGIISIKDPIREDCKRYFSPKFIPTRGNPIKSVFPTIEPSKIVVFLIFSILKNESIRKISIENRVMIVMLSNIKNQVSCLVKSTYQKVPIINDGRAM